MSTLAGLTAPYAARAGQAASTRLVRAWLWGLVALVLLMVAIGGMTRLTGSGLSITEWKPVTGAIPPLSDASWATEFEKYRASSQYRNLNRGMALAEFKTIYWWEWGHRQLGRFIGLFFFVPLAWFWLTGRVTARFALRLIGIGALGGLQAAVGWIMVASGLEPGMTAVAPLKLTLHLTIASAILALLVWTAVELRERESSRPRDGAASGPERWLYRPALVLLGLVFLQIAFGGLVAGSKAGWTYNTWPLMDGRLIPSTGALLAARPALENLVSNPALVQLNHRLLAYLVVAVALLLAWRAYRLSPGSAAANRAGGLAALALGQAALGVVTLLFAVPLWAGLAHQLGAMALLIGATMHARLCRGGDRVAAQPA